MEKPDYTVSYVAKSQPDANPAPVSVDAPNQVNPDKPKKKKKRRRKNYLLRLLIFVLLLVGLWFFTHSEFFLVEDIQVEGNKYFTLSQIIELSGLKTGENIIYESDLNTARRNILQSPYARVVNVKRILPNIVKIKVDERVEYAAIPYGEQYILIDKEGLILRITSDKVHLPILEGLDVKEPVEGKALVVSDNYLLASTLELLSVVNDADMYFKKVYFSTVVVKAYIYDQLYCEGSPENILNNIDGVKKLAEEKYQQGVYYGVIRVGSDGYFTFNPSID